jgi:hypothetical protein
MKVTGGAPCVDLDFDVGVDVDLDGNGDVNLIDPR